MTKRNQVQIDAGKKAEQRFKKMMEARGVKVEKSTDEEDMKKHIDYYISSDEYESSVDVKCMKSISRKNPKPQDKYIWVEFMNVGGEPGWLYGEAQFIAFETKDGFAMVDREKLIRYCDSVVDKTQSVSEPEDAVNKVYRRSGNKDSMTLLELAFVPHTKIIDKS